MKLELKKIDLRFEAEEHVHILKGEMVPGCTTVSGMMPKEWLAPWAAKETVEYILKNLDEKFKAKILTNQLTSEIKSVVMAGKNAWRMKRDKAADNGTRAHELIETYIKESQEPLLELEVPEVQNAVKLFFGWLEKHKVEWIASELQVGSETHKFAGILDFLAIVDGKFTLGDFKTSSGIHPEYYVQTAGLQIALEEMECPPIEQRLILHIPKTGNDFEARVVPTPIAHDKELFLCALQFYRCTKRLKDTCK